MKEESGDAEPVSPSPDASSHIHEAASSGPPPIEAFLGEPTRDLEAWSALFTADIPFPVQGSGGLRGRLARLVKKALRPLLRAALGDLFDRQRVFNLIAIESLISQRSLAEARHAENLGTFERLEARTTQSFEAAMRQGDALFARVDQKLDRYRREAKDLWHRLGALLEAQAALSASSGLSQTGEAQGGDGAGTLEPATAASILGEQSYLELEKRFRGSEQDIAGRVAAYLPYLEGCGDVLDLGCGRGEALEVMQKNGLEARGVDSSSEMVARCRERGLRAEQADLFDALGRLEEASVGAIVSFHVIEHLPDRAVASLIRLAWRALRPGGVLILETPSPLALAMSARDFWLDPTHRRPVHPGHLEVAFREAGFEPVHRLDLHPFDADKHLPEIDLESLPAQQRQLADQVNRLRDLLDDLLFGDRDFGMVGHKPAGAGGPSRAPSPPIDAP